ncbi:MAG TPA: FliM/FliN family flagellar motor switch protein [Terriglobales bacterium]|jgi:flagellar motor switch protein FliM
MEKVLNQDEIDQLVKTAPKDGTAHQRSIKPCSFRQSGQLTKEQIHAITVLHEGFARNLSLSLGAYLRVAFEVTLTSVEQLAYSEFLEHIPEVTYMSSFNVRQMNAAAAMQIDHSIVFPIVDVLLGGTGQCETLTREVTEIEEQIMDGVARIMCQQLHISWTPLGVEIAFEGRQASAQIKRFLAPPEKTLCLTFEVKLAETKGTLRTIFPVSVSNALLRKLANDLSYVRARSEHSDTRLAEKMMGCNFPVSLILPMVKLPVEVVLNLAAGQVCNLGIPVRVPAAVAITGRQAFEANPVRHGRHRAAQVGNVITLKEERK